MDRSFARVPTCGLVLLLCIWGGWSLTSAYMPGIHVTVAQSDGKVELEFHRISDDGRPLDEAARVHRFSVYVPGGSPTIWRILTVQPSKMTTRIQYGVVPDGFVQEEPTSGQAPSLEPGRTYSVAAVGEGAGFTSFTYGSR